MSGELRVAGGEWAGKPGSCGAYHCACVSACSRQAATGDPFEGERGLAVALTIVVVVAVTAFAPVTLLQPDFWRGAFAH